MRTKYIGVLEIGGNEVHITQVGDALVSGTACNVGLLQEYARMTQTHETLDEALQEFICDLEECNEHGARYMSSDTFPASELNERQRNHTLDNWDGPTFTAPTAWAYYLINGDASGLEDGEQEECDAASEGLGNCVDMREEGFLRSPDYGMAGNCSMFYFSK
jgi:hypothetical protein